MIVFCSDSHTAKGHIAVGNSAERLLEGGRTAIAIAPVDLGERVQGSGVQRIVAVGDADGGARQTAEALAAASAPPSSRSPASRPTCSLSTRARTPSRVASSLSSSASHLIETATCPVLVVPRGTTLGFRRRHARSGGRVAPARTTAQARGRSS